MCVQDLIVKRIQHPPATVVDLMLPDTHPEVAKFLEKEAKRMAPLSDRRRHHV